jgi:hypothetical protein
MVTCDSQRYIYIILSLPAHLLLGFFVGGRFRVFVGEYLVQVGGHMLIEA